MSRPLPAFPTDERVYAVGDIHGRADLLREILEIVSLDAGAQPPVATERLVFLGDYVDRGPASDQVINILLNQLPPRFKPEFLLGNHEQMLLDAHADQRYERLWLANGGGTTVAAYRNAAAGGAAPSDRSPPDSRIAALLPPAHLRFLQSLQLMVRHGDYIFVHAGLRPGVPLAQQTPHEMIWIREPFLSFDGDFGGVVVHGHTPDLEPVVRHNRIGIDTFAWQTGRLTAVSIDASGHRLLATGFVTRQPLS